MILGYTLTNIPQKFNTDKKQHKTKTSTKLRAVIEEGPCIHQPEESPLITSLLSQKTPTPQQD